VLLQHPSRIRLKRRKYMRKAAVSAAVLFILFSLSASVHAADSRPLPAETIAARQKFLGLDNVDPRTGAVRSDRVILSWIGVSSFVAAFKGHVVILDAYVARAGGFASAPWPGIRYVGATVEELAAVSPSSSSSATRTSITRAICPRS